jgi:predicted nucleic-acid-binding Zn-ribbon protein
MDKEPLIRWKFKCLKCGYRYQASMPKRIFNEETECIKCGSKEFEKKVLG